MKGTVTFLLCVDACILLLIEQCPIVKGQYENPKCTQRQSGACKTITRNSQQILLSEFTSPQPHGFLLKTLMEVNLVANQHNYENRITKENYRPIGYVIQSYRVRLTIWLETTMGRLPFLYIHLGHKSGRLAKLEYQDGLDERIKIKYCTFTPILPSFPYRLLLEMATNGKFSIYAGGNVEPFLRQQFHNISGVYSIGFTTPDESSDLVAFLDCTLEHETSSQPNCGSHRVDRLYGCRQSASGRFATVQPLQSYYSENVIFDEFMVLETNEFTFAFFPDTVSRDNSVSIDFYRNYIIAAVWQNSLKIKSIRALLTEVPANPYAVRVVITQTTNENYMKISNIRGDLILQLDLCAILPTIMYIEVYHPFINSKAYFDCIHPDTSMSDWRSDRPQKYSQTDTNVSYNEIGYNFTKRLLETRKYANVSMSYSLFNNGTEIGNQTDLCNPDKELFLPKVNLTNEQLSDKILLHLEMQSNKTAGAIDAILWQLDRLNIASAAANDAFLSESQNIWTDNVTVSSL